MIEKTINFKEQVYKAQYFNSIGVLWLTPENKGESYRFEAYR